jgi:hypothetical protein
MTSSDKYARLVKSNTLYSSTESNNVAVGGGGGGGDEALGIRCKTKAELNSNRRFKRESITNRNRFDIELYDELEETINHKKKLTRMIKAADSEDNIQEDNEEEEEEQQQQTPQAVDTLTHSSNKITNINTSLTTTTTTTTSSTGCVGGSSLTRADTIATTNRKRLLDEWRKRREENEARENLRRPVFKVCHVDVKDYALPSTPSTLMLAAQQQQHHLPSANFTFKVRKNLLV